MKKSELNTLRSFARHVGKVVEAMPCLDSSRHKPGVCNAWRLAKKELARVGKILENEIKMQNDDEHRTHNTAAG